MVSYISSSILNNLFILLDKRVFFRKRHRTKFVIFREKIENEFAWETFQKDICGPNIVIILYLQ